MTPLFVGNDYYSIEKMRQFFAYLNTFRQMSMMEDRQFLLIIRKPDRETKLVFDTSDKSFNTIKNQLRNLLRLFQQRGETIGLTLYAIPNKSRQAVCSDP